MAGGSESAASQQSLELDDQDTCGIDGDNEEETEHAKGSPGGDLGAKKKKKKQKRKKEKPNSGGTKSDSASDSQEIKIQQSSKHNAIWQQISAGAAMESHHPYSEATRHPESNGAAVCMPRPSQEH